MKILFVMVIYLVTTNGLQSGEKFGKMLLDALL